MKLLKRLAIQAFIYFEIRIFIRISTLNQTVHIMLNLFDWIEVISSFQRTLRWLSLQKLLSRLQRVWYSALNYLLHLVNIGLYLHQFLLIFFKFYIILIAFKLIIPELLPIVLDKHWFLWCFAALYNVPSTVYVTTFEPHSIWIIELLFLLDTYCLVQLNLNILEFAWLWKH